MFKPLRDLSVKKGARVCTKMLHLQLRIRFKADAVGLDGVKGQRQLGRHGDAQSVEALASKEIHKGAQRALPEAVDAECAGLCTKEDRAESQRASSLDNHLLR